MELKLLQSHQKGGVQLSAGSVIDVPEHKVEWFLQNGIAEKIEIIVPDSQPSSSRGKRRKKKS